MKVLVVGGGGREHAIITKLAQSKKITKLYAAPGNGGIASLAECVNIKATDIQGITDFAVNNKIDFVAVAPDDPLVMGLVDMLNEKGIRTFGPTKAAAIIEGSKAYSKHLMEKYNIPTAAYKVFTDSAAAVEYVKTQNTYPVVVKADGLALGKGVIIAENFDQAEQGIKSIMEDKIFGDSGNQLVIEEFLTGPEVSVLTFTDGKTIVPMISSMDHKRAYDGNQGPNTGGMGTVAPNPVYTPEIAQECMEKIFKPTVDALNKEGRTFKGCIFFGLMVTPKGVKVIEYNCRFGDPETQVVLPLLKTDLFSIFEAIDSQTLSDINIEWSNQSAACVVLASGGYPVKYQSGYEISGLDKQYPDVTVFHAGTKINENGKIVTAGGRVLGVTAVGDTLDKALEKAYAAAEQISFKDVHYRKDIGTSHLNK